MNCGCKILEDKYYYFVPNQYTDTGFTTTDEVRDWLFDNSLRIANLARVLFYYDSNYEPPKLPPIEIVAEKTINIAECMKDGVLADYLSFGSYYFVSQRLRDLFDQHNVSAFYSDAYVTIDGERYPGAYYFFAPKVALDTIDRKLSRYIENSQDNAAIKINKIEQLVLDENKVPPGTSVFTLAGTVKRIYLMSAQLSEHIQKSEIFGMEIHPVSDGKWLY